MKFNMLASGVSSFYMTLLTHDPDPAASTLQKTFQVRVDEGKYDSLDLTCSIARPKDDEVTTKTPFIPHFHGGTAADDDAFNDGKRFHVVKESEWQSTDRISMYLELAICSHHRLTTYLTYILSRLEIVKGKLCGGQDPNKPSLTLEWRKN
ncbi:hypothetical protein EUTSA_v10009725mg [Eutrema salsugineum]|uniref:Uncharacterized protein n=1 Tax=Eutrema salsugineum TaxID=72664 RepID=V4MRK2_EUTSA|nr:hypothetical protein EUTSA_v10009725mg [Eutrema salsugineum]